MVNVRLDAWPDITCCNEVLGGTYPWMLQVISESNIVWQIFRNETSVNTSQITVESDIASGTVYRLSEESV